MNGPGSRVGSRASGTAAFLALAVVLAACGSSSSSSSTSGVKGGSEVVAQAISTAGANPFTASVGTDHAGIKPPPGAASSSGGPVSYTASLPGLYGGTRNISTCDAHKLVSFLEANPAKATAWAGVLGIPTSQISHYVAGLTPVILRTDTRVTNHGYVNGQADALQSVLEAGTAVFVDDYGRPVVKCYCGNPLTPPQLLSAPVYTGPLWTGFSTTSITIIQQSTTIIKQFILYDPTTGKLYPQPPGINGKPGPYLQPGTTTTPTVTTATPTTPTATVPGTSVPTPTEHPSISLSPNPVTAGSTVTLSGSGYAPNIDVAITVNRPDGGTDHFSTSTDSSGNVTYVFPNAGGSITGTYTVTVTDPRSGANASATIDVVAPSGNSGGGHNSGGGNTGAGNTGAGNTGGGNTGAGNTGNSGH
jgi:Domain of unknown function (DUF6777)